MTDQSAIAISAVVPAYNRASLIGRAIDSMLRQTVPPAEIVVVDDGSKDRTREEVARFGERVRYVYQENAGASVARNRGVAEARHPWVAFLDSDDVWVEDHLARMTQAIASTGGASPLYFDDMEQTVDDGGGSLWNHIGFVVQPPHLLTQDAGGWAMMDRQPMMLQCSVFRRDAYLAAGGLRKEFWLTHDTHLFVVMGLGAPACAVTGFGTVQTSDDTPQGNRLTLTHGSKTRGYWVETAALWGDAVQHARRVSPAWVRELRARHANALWRLARHDWAEGQKGLAAWEVVRAMSTDVMFLPDLLRRTGRARVDGRGTLEVSDRNRVRGV